jgi:hypothetical protein
MKIDTILFLGGLAGIAYMLKQPKPVTRRDVTRTYKDSDPDEGEIGLSS